MYKLSDEIKSVKIITTENATIYNITTSLHTLFSANKLAIKL